MAQSFTQYCCRLFADFLRSAKPHKSAEGFVFFAQKKTEKPHGYSFSEHPCGFIAWSRIRDSNFLRSAKPHKSAEGFVFFAQKKTEKPHGYSFSEHPCGFIAWSRIRDSSPPPTAWEVWKVQIQRLRTIQFYNEISPHSFETVFFGFVLFRMNNAQITHKTVAQ